MHKHDYFLSSKVIVIGKLWLPVLCKMAIVYLNSNKSLKITQNFNSKIKLKILISSVESLNSEDTFKS